MISPNEFWLHLHRLAEAYDAEGLDTGQRATNIVAQFLDMPVVAQRHVLADLVMVSTRVPELYPLVIEATSKAEGERGRMERGNVG